MRKFPCITSFLLFFLFLGFLWWKCVGLYKILCLNLLRLLHFPPHILFIWWSTSICFQLLNQASINEVTSTLSWSIVLFRCGWIQLASNFVGILASEFINYITLNFSCGVFVIFWYHYNTGLHLEWTGKCSQFLNFFTRVCEGLVLILL